MPEHQDWQRQLLNVYDRSLSRAYLMDPFLYARLLKARERLAVQFEGASSPEMASSRSSEHRRAA
jgi:hypothetical protein